jgi:hypothetical protein
MNDQDRKALITHIKEQSIGEYELVDEFEMALFINKVRTFFGQEAK